MAREGRTDASTTCGGKTLIIGARCPCTSGYEMQAHSRKVGRIFETHQDSLRSLLRRRHIGNINTERSGQRDLMILLLYQDLPDVLGNRKFAQLLTLFHTYPIVAY